MKYIIILVTSFAYWQWISLYLFATSIQKGRDVMEIVKDKKLLDLIIRKAKLHLSCIRISSSSKLWGMMIGLPKLPLMFLSRPVYETFTEDELEYVILHETGHYVLSHSTKLAVLYFSLLGMGFAAVSNSDNPFFWIIIAVIIGGIQLQISRLCEHDADSFALRHIANPKGMITATRKFEKSYRDLKWLHHSEDTLLSRLMYMGIPYNERVRSAEREIKRRELILFLP